MKLLCIDDNWKKGELIPEKAPSPELFEEVEVSDTMMNEAERTFYSLKGFRRCAFSADHFVQVETDRDEKQIKIDRVIIDRSIRAARIRIIIGCAVVGGVIGYVVGRKLLK